MNRRQPTPRGGRKNLSHIDEMIASESIDSEPLWMRGMNGKPILTYAGSLNLAKLLGIERIYETFKSAPQSNGKVAYFAVVKCQLGTNTRLGAAVSRHPQVACELAYRNAIKQII